VQKQRQLLDFFSQRISDPRSIRTLRVRDKCFSTSTEKAAFPGREKRSSPWHFSQARSIINQRQVTAIFDNLRRVNSSFCSPVSTRIIACTHARRINSGAALVYGKPVTLRAYSSQIRKYIGCPWIIVLFLNYEKNNEIGKLFILIWKSGIICKKKHLIISLYGNPRLSIRTALYAIYCNLLSSYYLHYVT